MKKIIFLNMIIVLGTIITSNTANAQDTNTVTKFKQTDLSQAGGYSPFRLNLIELNEGIRYYDEGVYYFPVTEDQFGFMLAKFLKIHTSLEVTSMTGNVIRQNRFNETNESTDYGAAVGYFVTFREKK